MSKDPQTILMSGTYLLTFLYYTAICIIEKYRREKIRIKGKQGENIKPTIILSSGGIHHLLAILCISFQDMLSKRAIQRKLF